MSLCVFSHFLALAVCVWLRYLECVCVFVSSAARRQRARAKRKPILQAIKTRFHKTRGIIGFFCRSFPPTISDAREKLNPPLIYALIFHQLCFLRPTSNKICVLLPSLTKHTRPFSLPFPNNTLYTFLSPSKTLFVCANYKSMWKS
jgi:hypothetical protein